MKISIEVPDGRVKQLEEAAKRLHVQTEGLASAAVADLLSEAEPEFERVAARVLAKNRDLYRRLA